MTLLLLLLSLFQPITDHPQRIHYPTHIWPQGNRLEIEDGTCWEIKKEHRPYLAEWTIYDRIEIIPNFTPFSSYPYHLENHSSNHIVSARLHKKHTTSGLQLVEFSIDSCQLLLSDGSAWTVSKLDYGILKSWRPNHPILIGTNRGINSYFNNHLLINTQTNTSVRATCLSLEPLF